MVTLPKQLVRLATIGTSSQTDATLSETLLPINEQDNATNPIERSLLRTVGAYGLQQQAGYLPSQTSKGSGSQVPISDAKPCSATAGQHLILMLNGRHQELLPTWFQLLADNQQHIPYELLPALLDFGAKKKIYKTLLRPIIKQRGRWLTHQVNNTKWQWVLQNKSAVKVYAADYAAWSDHFVYLREVDANHALTILQRYWDDLDLLMKMSLLGQMHIGLNPHDTDFLIQLLDNPLTQPEAVKLLLMLKTSDFALAFFEEAKQLFSLKQDAHTGEWVVNLTWSIRRDAQGNKDEQSAYSTIMGYQFRRDNILSFLPLSYWYETYQVTPDILIQAAKNSTQPTTFFWAWRDKAIETSDNDFLFALAMRAEHYTGSPIVDHLTDAQLTNAAIHWLTQKPIFALDHPAIPLLGALQVVWHDDLAQAFLISLKAQFCISNRPLLLADMRKYLKQYAIYLPLSVTDQLEAVLHINSHGILSDTEIEEVNGIIDIMTFRAEMMLAIQNG